MAVLSGLNALAVHWAMGSFRLARAVTILSFWTHLKNFMQFEPYLVVCAHSHFLLFS